MARPNQEISDAFNSMLRTDYVALKDTAKLNLLAEYYIDYYNFLNQILSEYDQLIVGRRGTGKTTLLYRALVECMRSWEPGRHSAAKPRTLAIYVDLSKCQSISESADEDFTDFEHIVVSELCDAISEEIRRSWPAAEAEPGFFSQLFASAEQKQAQRTKQLLGHLATILKSGLPRIIDQSGRVDTKDTSKTKKEGESSVKAVLGDQPSITGGVKSISESAFEHEDASGYTVTYRLTVADILQVLGELREAADISAIFLLVDEFSALSEDLQRRFTTLVKKLVGNHSGLFIKLCAITDKYTLGSSLILQRDLFEISLDLDAFVERSDSLNAAMAELESLTDRIITERLRVYAAIVPKDLFEEPAHAWTELSRAAMGVPRTLGIVLTQAWNRASPDGRRMRTTDIEYGIRYASKTYFNQLIGAARDNVAIPQYVAEITDAIITRAANERGRGAPASHFMVLPKNEAKLKYLTMCFVVHLLTSGRTTKKEKASRSLYCIDYGICLEHNLSFASDKNVIRQQRFAYDDELAQFDHYFEKGDEPRYSCPSCGAIYAEGELRIRGKVMLVCVNDRQELQTYDAGALEKKYTEEEMKIIGSIRSSSPQERLVARRVADDVGCYVQKVAQFGGKLARERIIARERIEELNRNIYYGPDTGGRRSDERSS